MFRSGRGHLLRRATPDEGKAMWVAAATVAVAVAEVKRVTYFYIT
jgi:hypothetical protein